MNQLSARITRHMNALNQGGNGPILPPGLNRRTRL